MASIKIVITIFMMSCLIIINVRLRSGGRVFMRSGARGESASHDYLRVWAVSWRRASLVMLRMARSSVGRRGLRSGGPASICASMRSRRCWLARICACVIVMWPPLYTGWTGFFSPCARANFARGLGHHYDGRPYGHRARAREFAAEIRDFRALGVVARGGGPRG